MDSHGFPSNFLDALQACNGRSDWRSAPSLWKIQWSVNVHIYIYVDIIYIYIHVYTAYIKTEKYIYIYIYIHVSVGESASGERGPSVLSGRTDTTLHESLQLSETTLHHSQNNRVSAPQGRKAQLTTETALALRHPAIWMEHPITLDPTPTQDEAIDNQQKPADKNDLQIYTYICGIHELLQRFFYWQGTA